MRPDVKIIYTKTEIWCRCRPPADGEKPRKVLLPGYLVTTEPPVFPFDTYDLVAVRGVKRPADPWSQYREMLPDWRLVLRATGGVASAFGRAPTRGEVVDKVLDRDAARLAAADALAPENIIKGAARLAEAVEVTMARGAYT